eukprot:CAMPEP_0195529002 /NCGR_PEP_ID=MMETSP0794_2-20130614/31387_1 /TAXON_ID=515487 /ORGANISM="Stephanopyxis turris, Strain CCMP 815" /LENGTH=148 /DNA_ID=CAMNT_0040660235 /DNA_START=97 /DNA_END=541 /DNA_ORIENTATION=-
MRLLNHGTRRGGGALGTERVTEPGATRGTDSRSGPGDPKLEVPAHALGRVLVLVYGSARQQSGLRQSVVPEIPGHLAVLPVLALLRHLAWGVVVRIFSGTHSQSIGQQGGAQQEQDTRQNAKDFHCVADVKAEYVRGRLFRGKAVNCS